MVSSKLLRPYANNRQMNDEMHVYLCSHMISRMRVKPASEIVDPLGYLARDNVLGGNGEGRL